MEKGIEGNNNILERENFDLKINYAIMTEEVKTLQELNDLNSRELQKMRVDLEQKSVLLKENENLIHQLRAALVIAGDRIQFSQKSLDSNSTDIHEKDILISDLRERLVNIDERMDISKVIFN